MTRSNMKKIYLILIYSIFSTFLFSQQIQEERKTYKLADVTISGYTKYKKGAVMSFTKLKIGDEITIPGNNISFAIKRLMDTGLFNDVEIYIDKIEDDQITLRLQLEGLPTLSDVEVKGVKKNKIEDIVKENNLKTGERVTEHLLNSTRSKIEKQYKDKGFLYAKAKTSLSQPDSTNRVKLTINVNKGNKIKINDIVFEGNKEFRDAQLRKKGFKKTKRKSLNFLQSHKFNPELFETDKKNLINFYRSFGFRDANITFDTIFNHDDKSIDIKVGVSEGIRYYIRNINFVGNTKFSTDGLKKLVGYLSGDPYDAIGFQNKISGDPKEQDISTLYYDDGYIFSRIVPYEVNVVGDSIDLEVRINEGEQAFYKRITFEGNTTTFDHVVARNIPTKPGEKFSKSGLKQGYYRLGQLGYFDPQQIEPDVQPNPQDNTVDVNWKLAEQGASQIELQGGYGGGRFIGTLGLTLNNFSLRNVLNGKAWKPFPQGDGQQVSLRASGGHNYQNYSLSFTEPWIFGKRPTALTASIYHSVFRNSVTDGDVQITGATLGLNHTLNWPDSYFRLSHSIGYKRYNLNNYSLGSVFNFTEGASNNINYNISFGRFSAGPDPIFPTNGSDVNISASFTPPFSMFKEKGWYKLSPEDEARIRQEQFPNAQNSATADQYIEGIEEAEKYKWLEYYKIKFKTDFYKQIAGKLVLRLGGEFGFLGAYNNDVGISQFERFYMGGTGLFGNNFDGREQIALRGYEDASNNGGSKSDVTPIGGGVVYNKFISELRYPISMGQAAKIYALGFFEAGNVWDDKEQYQPFELKRAMGVGLRVFMPAFGLLGIDFGYGMDPYPNQNEPSGWVTHFILGQQF